MQRTTIDGTGIEVSRLALGTGSLHHLIRGSQRRWLFDHAAALGITHFDTSPYYGDGLAESDLGSWLRGRRATFTVTSKIGLYPRGSSVRTGFGVWCRRAVGKLLPAMKHPVEDWSVPRACASLEASLGRLQSDHVDFLLVHEPWLDAAAADSLLDWMQSEQRRGTIRAFGVAGTEARIGELVRLRHPLTQVVQTKDTIAGQEADFVARAGRPLQFTYGYLSRNGAIGMEPRAALSAALQRNATGAVIVSSRRPDRITALASCTR
jgi:aryl-alcohol dehydrogenase-like predicted oxidoreductase